MHTAQASGSPEFEGPGGSPYSAGHTRYRCASRYLQTHPHRATPSLQNTPRARMVAANDAHRLRRACCTMMDRIRRIQSTSTHRYEVLLTPTGTAATVVVVTRLVQRSDVHWWPGPGTSHHGCRCRCMQNQNLVRTYSYSTLEPRVSPSAAWHFEGGARTPTRPQGWLAFATE